MKRTGKYLITLAALGVMAAGCSEPGTMERYSTLDQGFYKIKRAWQTAERDVSSKEFTVTAVIYNSANPEVFLKEFNKFMNGATYRPETAIIWPTDKHPYEAIFIELKFDGNRRNAVLFSEQLDRVIREYEYRYNVPRQQSVSP